MTTREVVLSTGVCEHSVYRALNNGQLPASRIGRRWEIQAQDVMEWAKESWEAKRHIMFEPDRIAVNIAEFTAH